jgi:hypothetical protein
MAVSQPRAGDVDTAYVNEVEVVVLAWSGGAAPPFHEKSQLATSSPDAVNGNAGEDAIADGDVFEAGVALHDPALGKKDDASADRTMREAAPLHIAVGIARG